MMEGRRFGTGCAPVRPGKEPELVQVVDCRSGFDFALELETHDGELVAFPPWDFTLALYVAGRAARYVVGQRGGVLTGCYEDDGRVHVVADDHGLPPGRLRGLLTCMLPDPTYPDGIHEAVTDFDTGIELRAGTVCPCRGVVLRPVVARVPLAGMEEITAEEVAAMFDALGGGEFTPLRPATDEEIDALFDSTGDGPLNDGLK